MKYNLEKHVMENPDLRQSYNKLAEQTFGLNFEKWYQDRCFQRLRIHKVNI